MKKRIAFVIMAVCICMASITGSGCGKEKETNNTVKVDDSTVVDTDQD